ncbi:hypothetical protein F4861DRAFT_534564 [Xylaria intraflava]|nr:hypothetical protein F4861DRAFT_534564 [Xylaria intraflava]
MPTSIQSPSLPPDWAPNTASCLFSTDYWIWDYGSAGDAPTVLGGPSQTTACLPTGWGADVLYSGTACPSLYTPGCPESNGVVTCCPDTYDFTCVSNDFKPDNHGSVIRCVTPYTTQDVVKVTRTVFHNSQRTAAFETRSTGNHLFALAVMYTTPVRSTYVDR